MGLDAFWLKDPFLSFPTLPDLLCGAKGEDLRWELTL